MLVLIPTCTVPVDPQKVTHLIQCHLLFEERILEIQPPHRIATSHRRDRVGPLLALRGSPSGSEDCVDELVGFVGLVIAGSVNYERLLLKGAVTVANIDLYLGGQVETPISSASWTEDRIQNITGICGDVINYTLSEVYLGLVGVYLRERSRCFPNPSKYRSFEYS